MKVEAATMNRPMNRLATIAVFCAALLVSAPGAANASPHSGQVVISSVHPPVVTIASTHPSKGAVAPNSLSGGDGGPGCIAAANPQPQLSNGFVHWGVKVTCDVPEQVTINVVLYAYRGANAVYEDQNVTSGLGFVIATPSLTTQCVGTASTYWSFEATFSSPNLVWTPNPAWSPSVNLACGGLDF
jgi:hypothetical protein